MRSNRLLASAAAAIVLLAAPAAHAAIPRGQTSKVVRIDGRRAKVTLSTRVTALIVFPTLGADGEGPGRVDTLGGSVDAFVSIDMLDNDPVPEGLTFERIRLVRATPDASGRRTWNPELDPGSGAAQADLMFGQALDGPAWEQGARVDARVRLSLDGEAIIVDFGQMRIGGQFTLAVP